MDFKKSLHPSMSIFCRMPEKIANCIDKALREDEIISKIKKLFK